MHMVINKTNQILDFNERHCINEYKSAYVLRCRSTNRTNYKNRTFSNKGINLWNKHPLQYKQIRSFPVFKKAIKLYLLHSDTNN